MNKKRIIIITIVVILIVIFALWISGIIPKQIARISATNYLKKNFPEKQVKRVKKLFSESSISERYWLRQWFMMVCIDYLKMTKNKRQKEMMHIITSICESYLYNEYNEIKNEVKEYAKENNIIETEVEYGEYPEEVEW